MMIARNVVNMVFYDIVARCYTVDPEVRWEYCSQVLECSMTSVPGFERTISIFVEVLLF